MKTDSNLLVLLSLVLFQFSVAQKTPSALPKIEDYTRGALEIKVTPFGLTNPIHVGEITTDGTIHFNWDNDIILNKEDKEFYMSSLTNAIGMTFCNDKEIEQNNKDAKSIHSKELFLYKDGQQVGALLPATDKKMEDNLGSNRHTGLVLGSTISWVYTDDDVLFKGKCSVNFEQENLYNFKEVTRYDLNLKKGWNSILNTLAAKEDWKNETEMGSLPKTIIKTAITEIPHNMNWYLNYWAE